MNDFNILLVTVLTVFFISVLVIVKRSTIRKFTGHSSLKHLPTESFKSYTKKYHFVNGLEASQGELDVQQMSVLVGLVSDAFDLEDLQKGIEIKKLTEALKDKNALVKFLCTVLNLDEFNEATVQLVKTIKLQEVGVIMKDFFLFNPSVKNLLTVLKSVAIISGDLQKELKDMTGNKKKTSMNSMNI